MRRDGNEGAGGVYAKGRAGLSDEGWKENFSLEEMGEKRSETYPHGHWCFQDTIMNKDAMG